jgi:hypothetical protein
MIGRNATHSQQSVVVLERTDQMNRIEAFGGQGSEPGTACGVEAY